MSASRASEKPKAIILKGFEGLSRLKDKQSSADQSISEGHKNTGEPHEAYIQKAVH